jgi:hypothetical protein
MGFRIDIMGRTVPHDGLLSDYFKAVFVLRYKVQSPSMPIIASEIRHARMSDLFRRH